MKLSTPVDPFTRCDRSTRLRHRVRAPFACFIRSPRNETPNKFYRISSDGARAREKNNSVVFRVTKRSETFLTLGQDT